MYDCRSTRHTGIYIKNIQNMKNINLIKILNNPSKYVESFHLFQSGSHFQVFNPRSTENNDFLMWEAGLTANPKNRRCDQNNIRNIKIRYINVRKKLVKIPYNIRRRYFSINCHNFEHKIYMVLK